MSGNAVYQKTFGLASAAKGILLRIYLPEAFTPGVTLGAALQRHDGALRFECSGNPGGNARAEKRRERSWKFTSGCRFPSAIHLLPPQAGCPFLASLHPK